MNGIRWLAGVGAALLLTCGPARAGEADPVRVLELPARAAAVAIDPESGAVALADTAGGAIRVYPDLPEDWTAGARVVRVAAPQDVVFKRVGDKSYFAALCGDGTLALIDAKTAEVGATIRLSLGRPRGLAASRRSDDPFVYYTGGPDQDGRFAAVDLAARADRGALNGEAVTTVAVSADGRSIYSTNRWSRQGIEVGELTPAAAAAPAYRKVRYEQSAGRSLNDQPWALDPLGRFLMAGVLVWEADLSRSIRSVTAEGRLVCAARPLVVGQRTSRMDSSVGFDSGTVELEFFSANTFAPVRRLSVPLTPGARRPRPAFPFGAVEPLLFAEHEKSKTLLVLRGQRVAHIPPEAVPAAGEPVLAVTASGEAVGAVGRKLELTLTPADPRTAVTVESGPRGLAVRGNRLTWTPGPDDVGAAKVVLRLTIGKASATKALALTVRRPGLTLPLAVERLAVAADGRTALALCRPPAAGDPFNRRLSDSYSYRGGYASTSGTTLLLLDLDAGAIRARRELPAPARDIHLDAHHAYAVMAGSDSLAVLDPATLADRRRLFTPAQVTGVVTLADRYLWVATQSGSTVLALPGLTPAALDAPGVGPLLSARGRSAAWHPPVALGASWYHEGVVYDRTLTRAERVDRPAGVVADGTGAAPAFPDPSRGPPPVPEWLGPWGRVTAKLRGDPNVKADPTAGALVLTARPAVAALRVTVHPEPAKVALEFSTLGGDPVRSVQLLNEATPAGAGGLAGLVEAGGRLVAFAGTRVFVVPVPETPAAEFPEPPRLAAAAPAWLPEAGGEVALPPTRGGAAPVELTLEREVPGVAFDGTKLLVDAEALRPFLARNARMLADADRRGCRRLRPPGGAADRPAGGGRAGLADAPLQGAGRRRARVRRRCRLLRRRAGGRHPRRPGPTRAGRRRGAAPRPARPHRWSKRRVPRGEPAAASGGAGGATGAPGARPDATPAGARSEGAEADRKSVV